MANDLPPLPTRARASKVLKPHVSISLCTSTTVPEKRQGVHTDAAVGGSSYMLKSGAPTGVRCEGGDIHVTCHVAKAP